MNNFSINISKFTDERIIRTLIECSARSELKLNPITLNPVYGGGAIVINPDGFEANENFKLLAELKSEIINSFGFQYEQDFSIHIHRPDGESSDKLTFNIANLKSNHSSGFAKFYSDIRHNLKAVDSELFIKNALSDDLKRHYETRESELSKLEDIAKSILYKQQEFTKQKDEEFKAKHSELEQKFAKKEEQLQADIHRRFEELNNERMALDEKLKEIDDRESKHVRRKIREDLKTELKNRSKTFELTQGTRNLRVPIFWFTIFLLVFFGSGLILYSYFSVTSIISSSQNTAEIISLVLKQFTFAVAFGSTSVFFIRWNNKWFEQHANEEFRLKRHELDLDRASWLVEMALEWKNEKGTEIPKELVDRLSQNLFSETKEEKVDLHPADQLASSLFGAASNIHIKGPNGVEAVFDRKSISELQKRSN